MSVSDDDLLELVGRVLRAADPVPDRVIEGARAAWTWRTKRHAILTQRKASYEPFISVIIRCGGRSVDLIRRALCSLSQQTYGQFEVIFVRYKDIDLSSLLSKPYADVC